MAVPQAAAALLPLLVPAVPAAPDSWVQLCGRLAPAASAALFFAPLPTLLAVAGGRRSAAGLPLLPYSSMVCNALLWTSYGVLRAEPRIWAANAVGLVMGAFYVATYLRHCTDDGGGTPALTTPSRRRYAAHLQAIGLAAALAGLLTVQNQPDWIGRIAVMVCVVMFASPLAAARQVVRERSASRIPLPFTLASLANCGLWTVSGLLDMKDPAIVVPNALGLASGAVQLGLKLVFASNKGGRHGHNLGSALSSSLPPL
jgi:uncharacterized protein with PQ loop repeat